MLLGIFLYISAATPSKLVPNTMYARSELVKPIIILQLSQKWRISIPIREIIRQQIGTSRVKVFAKKDFTSSGEGPSLEFTFGSFMKFSLLLGENRSGISTKVLLSLYIFFSCTVCKIIPVQNMLHTPLTLAILLGLMLSQASNEAPHRRFWRCEAKSSSPFPSWWW